MSNELRDKWSPTAERKMNAKKRAHLTVSPEEIKDGKLCDCEACVKDGQHEPDCCVHDEPKGPCSCGVEEQREGAS